MWKAAGWQEYASGNGGDSVGGQLFYSREIALQEIVLDAEQFKNVWYE